MREYFDKHFAGSGLLRALGPNYWLRAAAVIPTLPPAARAEAYAPLWNNTPALTAVAAELIAALASLQFPDVAFCGLDALMPREISVLDANLVFGLGAPGHRRASPWSPPAGRAPRWAAPCWPR